MGGWRRRAALLLGLVGVLACPALAEPPAAPVYRRDPIILYAAQTSAIADPTPAWVGDASVVMLQVCVAAGTCTDLSVVPEGRVAESGAYSPIPVAGGNADIREGDVPVGECRSWSIDPGNRWFRARPATVSTCSVSAYLHLMP